MKAAVTLLKGDLSLERITIKTNSTIVVTVIIAVFVSSSASGIFSFLK